MMNFKLEDLYNILKMKAIIGLILIMNQDTIFNR